MGNDESKTAEREATTQANDLLRRLSREVFQDGIDIEQLPHAVGLVMDFAQASADAALEKILEYIPTVTGPTGGWLVSPKTVENAILALKSDGRRDR